MDSTRIHESDSDPDKGTPAATRFVLGVIPARILARINDKATRFEGMPGGGQLKMDFSAHATCLEMLRWGLKGWENLLDAGTGQPLAFETREELDGNIRTKVPTDACLTAVPGDLRMELANAIRDFNTVTRTDQVSPSGGAGDQPATAA
ncbi:MULTISPECIES: hypothetical protein [unclassified Azospirillum]|uniref:hypothetical protein n=1 Tax=unclassified Azospirillum TaxID=2630922 RepID=UPI000B774E34|nr:MULTISPECIES: hypothetical protein [unclassified Azospirillum]